VLSIRKQAGQLQTGRNILKFLKGSNIAAQPKKQVQDPYCFRCAPQVHGASKDAIDYAIRVFENEINSVTDNPTIFPDEDRIVSAGNFHGQPLAITLDFLAIALAELASISERRIYKLISGQRNLPAFLVANSGLNSGFMIVQYAAASVVSQNKQLCTPASVDTIDSSNGQEDHVSMGANAATKCYKVLENLEKVISLELFVSSQALEMKRPLKSSKFVEDLVSNFRKEVPFISEDVVMYPLMEKARTFLKQLRIKNYEKQITL
jgi:histidine ammonia-lyase